MTQAATDWEAKIRKLLAVAEDPAMTEEAAETYRQKAYALMTQFEIEEATLRRDERLATEKVIRLDWKDVDLGKTYAYEFSHLVANVAKAHGMHGYIGKSYYNLDGSVVRGAARSYPVIVGFESDVERLKMLVQSLITQCNTALTKHVKAWVAERKDSWYTPTASDKYNQRRSFIVGYGERLEDRITEARRATVQEAEVSAPGTALVLVSKSEQVDSWVNENMTFSAGRSKRYGYDGAAAGRRAANSADLGQQRFGTGRGAIES